MMSKFYLRHGARVGLMAGACLMFGGALGSSAALADRSMLRGAQSWAYQLQGDASRIAGSGADVAVVDADHMRGAVSRLRRKPDGGRRAVIAYVAIGEAERWRGYWKSCCSNGSPSWLTGRTQGWSGNYIVKFWDSGWKSIVKSRVRQVLAAGFDGLYLDRVDTWENIKAPGGSRSAMIELVRDITAYARSIKPGVAIIVQNGEELLSSSSYLSAIDAVAKEDLFHGINHDGGRNASGDIAESVRMLKGAQSKGKKIFVIEYLSGATAQRVRGEIRRYGFVPAFGPRDLRSSWQ